MTVTAIRIPLPATILKREEKNPYIQVVPPVYQDSEFHYNRPRRLTIHSKKTHIPSRHFEEKEIKVVHMYGSVFVSSPLIPNFMTIGKCGRNRQTNRRTNIHTDEMPNAFMCVGHTPLHLNIALITCLSFTRLINSKLHFDKSWRNFDRSTVLPSYSNKG